VIRTTVLGAPIVGAAFFATLVERLGAGERGVTLTGLVGGARAAVLCLLAAAARRRLLLVVPDDSALDDWERDLKAIAPLVGQDPRRIARFPALDADPWDGIAPHPEVARERVVALTRLAQRDLDVVLTPARALLTWLPSPEELAARTRTVRPGDHVPPDRFVLEAIAAGYRRVEIVSAPGEVSRRGGIVDVFSPLAEEPVRIELFGDTVESLRAFDTDHQRSTRGLDEAVIGPAVESPPGSDAFERLAGALADVVRGSSNERLEQLRARGYFPGIEALARLTAARPVMLTDHAPDLSVVVAEPERADDELVVALHDARASWEQGDNRAFPPPERLFVPAAEARAVLARAALRVQELAIDAAAGAGPSVCVVSRPTPMYGGKIPRLVADLEAARATQRRTVCVLRATGSARRLAEILDTHGLAPAVAEARLPEAEGAPAAGGLFVTVGGLRAGFELPELGVTVLAERNAFGEEPRSADRKPGSRAAFLSDFRDLKPGDVVVHVDHGLARYAGLGRPKGGSLNRDFMILEFDGGDRLFVPADRLDLVQKYSGVAGHAPRLDRLGGTGWERVRARVRASVASMAKELLELYARRRAATGHAFSPDTPWQRELEAAFPYEPTPDQQRTIEDVKRDMEASVPMDRLVIGDVGFGKTEVAVRAAFKAVMDGFQVAVLAPTTVLAVQHYRTFRDRFAPFPVRVEMVSRFRGDSEIRRTLTRVENGDVDVLVGTHRLLSKDVRYRRLGLLVVDEEQRFGVAHKERLKKLSLHIDVLTLTATPIPRTLQMSLAGVRDLSIIESPPPGRTAIQTHLVPFRKAVVAQAIRQELRRQGQVFVVHNRVETLPALVRALREMVPEARIAAAHGQMPEHELERAMLRFVDHEVDILATTTIIENGLDIPRANTIVVNRADRFGLAQLYQLRGRVGRSEQHAFAYFIVPSPHTLTEPARRRLKALQEFSELGAGFRLAAADLEIRGAGEFLGTRQHGHIAALGFDLYCQMIERAVREFRGEVVEERAAPALHLGVDIKVPERYLPDEGDRLALYKRLAVARDLAEVDRLQADTVDRYGHLPPSGQNLFELARLRLIAGQAGVKSVDVAGERIQIRFHDGAGLEPQRVVEIVARERGTLTPSGMMILPAPERAADRIQAVRGLLERCLGRSAA
jgi:transcription-repair coupling factor (superfamily II helicase)